MFASMGCFFSPQLGGIAGKWHGKKRFMGAMSHHSAADMPDHIAAGKPALSVALRASFLWQRPALKISLSAGR